MTQVLRDPREVIREEPLMHAPIRLRARGFKFNRLQRMCAHRDALVHRAGRQHAVDGVWI